MIQITPLEGWIHRKAVIRDALEGEFFLKALREYQLRKVNEVIDHARRNTPFYRRLLSRRPNESCLTSLSRLSQIPFTTPSDLVKNPFDFMAVSQGEIARIVTMQTSGSTGEAKRLFFTEDDLELTLDFFHHGMSTLVKPGQRVGIFLPGESPDSVGDLLVRGLKRLNVQALAYGSVIDPLQAAETMDSFKAHCLIGLPTQILAVASSRSGTAIGKGRIESILLISDYIPTPLINSLKEIWGCRVFSHYGMTEMGLGGGVECGALDGYHLREGDLYFEVVDHQTGELCPDGEMGEVVFTTLTRKGMPLIRYRTGDMARFISEPCPCGSILRRLGRIGGRYDGLVPLGPDCILSLPLMDEALFGLPGLLDYRASVTQGETARFRLNIDIYKKMEISLTDNEVFRKLIEVASIRKGMARRYLEQPTVHFAAEGSWPVYGGAKRKIDVM